MNLEHRWQVAIHEAGHVVAGFVLGGKVDGALCLNRGGGLAFVTMQSPTDDAFMIAAGPAAEALAQKHQAPAAPVRSVAEMRELADSPLVPYAVALSVECVVDSEDACDKVPSDEKRLALWAIDGFERQPERWAERVAFAHHMASKIVSDHEAAIIALAQMLFVDGFVTKDDVESIVKGEQACQ